MSARSRGWTVPHDWAEVENGSGPALLHNMSAPPRTDVKCVQRAVHGRPVVFSLPHVLVAAGLLVPRIGPAYRFVQRIEKQARERWGGCVDRLLEEAARQGCLDDERLRSRAPLEGALIGWVPTCAEEAPEGLCEDLTLTIQVLERCVGSLYLGAREPERTWRRLFSGPVAFDDPRLETRPLAPTQPALAAERRDAR